ncbi:MAG: hypothetical protein WAT88_14285, partial [Saprospiraceae bacterium]
VLTIQITVTTNSASIHLSPGWYEKYNLPTSIIKVRRIKTIGKCNNTGWNLPSIKSTIGACLISK